MGFGFAGGYPLCAGYVFEYFFARAIFWSTMMEYFVLVSRPGGVFVGVFRFGVAFRGPPRGVFV